MLNYAFILGRKHLLSTAEICQTFGEKKITDLCPTAAIVKMETGLKNPQETLNQLGGTVKIAEIFNTVALQDVNKAGEIIGEYLCTEFENRPSKLNYAVSVYNLTGRHDLFLRKTLNFVKKQLQAANIKSRFINKNFKNPENAALKGEKIIEQGAEIMIIQTYQNIYFARTVALQDFEAYSQRDYDRPERDPHLGMLPPKLAQIMINLTGLHPLTQVSEQTSTSKKQTILDPFCGLGTVLTEGLLMDFNMVGSDLEASVITRSKKNIEYVLSLTKNDAPNWRLFKKDATQLARNDFQEKIDAVVTETYLGPAVSQFPNPQNLEKTFDNIRPIIRGFLESIHPLLQSGAPVVFSLLVYRRSDRYFFLENLMETVNEIGYQIAPLIPYQLAKKYHLKVFERPSLVYDRPDQIVGREIWKLIRQ